MGCISTSAKFSILCFYHYIFAVYRTTLKATYGTAVVCIFWFIIVTFVFISQCNPVDAYWSLLGQPPACYESQRLVLGYELTNFFVDVIILCLPIKAFKELQLSPVKKGTTLGIFLLGGLYVCRCEDHQFLSPSLADLASVCVASIIRMTAVYDARNPSREGELLLSLVTVYSC
jgi:hypothetical protein